MNHLQNVILNPVRSWPSYVLSADATVTQMRQTVLRAMEDLLSVPWTPGRDFHYVKGTSSKPRNYDFSAGTAYAGLPYTDGCSGIFQFLACCPEPGILSGCDFENFNLTMGNSCASCCLSALAASCPSTSLAFSTATMTMENGFSPLGGVDTIIV